jgi:hypothetical protein
MSKEANRNVHDESNEPATTILIRTSDIVEIHEYRPRKEVPYVEFITRAGRKFRLHFRKAMDYAKIIAKTKAEFIEVYPEVYL